MRVKALFLAVVMMLLLSSVNALEYRHFDSREKFTDFLGQANDMQLDLRNDYETSLSIIEQAEEYDVDLHYYPEMELYENVFSKFSWWLTGFVTGDIEDGPLISVDKETVASGETIRVKVGNIEQVLSDKVAITIGGKVVASFPKGDKSSYPVEVSVPEMEPGTYKIGILGEDVQEEINIKGQTMEDPLLKLSTTNVEPGDEVVITGANMPFSEMKVLVGDQAIGAVAPEKGVFKLIWEVDVRPGKYTVKVEGLESASSELYVEIPYKEPRLRISENSLIKGEGVVVEGDYFPEEDVDLFVSGPTEQKLSFYADGGSFSEDIDTSEMQEGSYTIFSKEYGSAEASFNVKEETPEVEASLETHQSSVERGIDILVMGKDFPESVKNVLFVDDNKIEVKSDSTGEFSKNLDTSDMSIGTHKIYWKEDPEIAVPFNVEKPEPNPTLGIEDKKIYVGDSFELSGENFFDQDSVEIYIDDTFVGDAKLDNSGFSYNIDTSEVKILPGSHEVIVKYGGESVSIALNLEEPKDEVLKVEEDHIYVGESFSVTGHFFRDDVLSLMIDDSLIGEVRTDDHGSFEVEVKLSDNIGPGSYKLAAYDGEGTSLTATAIDIKQSQGPVINIVEKSIDEKDTITIIGKFFDTDKVRLIIGEPSSEETSYYSKIVPVEENSFIHKVNLEENDISAGSYKVYTEEPFSVTALNVNPVQGEPAIKVKRKEIVEGKTQVFYGYNFVDYGDEAVLLIDDKKAYPIVFTGSGTFEKEVDTSGFGSGFHEARVQGYKASTGFNVIAMGEKPYIDVKKKIVKGDPVLVEGYNFDPLIESVVATLDGKKTYTAYPDNGDFNLEIDSADLGEGYHYIEIRDYGLSASFTILNEQEPSLDIINEKVYDGEIVEVRGYDFPKMEKLNLKVDGIKVEEVFTDDGNFEIDFNSSEVGIGYHSFYVERYENVVVSFTVKEKETERPEIRLSNKEVTMGMLLGINGFNFPYSPQETLVIYLDGGEKLSIAYPEDGSFTASFLVPELESGTHTVSAKGFSTASQTFVYSEQASSKPQMTLFREQGLPETRVDGVVNNLPKGVVKKMDLLLGDQDIGEIQSTGTGSVLFYFYTPSFNAGNYHVGLAGLNPEMATYQILPEPEVEKQDYSDKEAEEIAKEVQNYYLGKQEEDVMVEQQQALQERVVGGITGGIVSDTCEPVCVQKCGQPDNCGGYCDTSDLDKEGKCGNALPRDSAFGRSADQLADTTANILNRVLAIN